MATYNGERHILEQLESLSNQTLLPHELQIGDDSSSDATLSIIRDFAKSAPFPVSVHANPTNLGYAQNFIETAKRCTGDWIAFCDQDDLWMPNKLERCANIIRAASEDTVLIAHAVAIVGDDLRPTGQSLPPHPRTATHGPLTRPLFWSHQGSSQVIRSDMVGGIDHSARAPTVFTNVDPYPHDSWFALCANVLGTTVELAEHLGLYRRHEASVSATGKGNRGFSLADLIATGAEHYRHMHRICDQTVHSFDIQKHRLASAVWRERLDRGANRFRILSGAYETRAMIYDGAKLGDRLAAVIALATSPGYFQLGPSSFGLRALIKDLAASLALGFASQGRRSPKSDGNPMR